MQWKRALWIQGLFFLFSVQSTYILNVLKLTTSKLKPLVMLLMLVCGSENEDDRLADDILAVSGDPSQEKEGVKDREGKELWEK